MDIAVFGNINIDIIALMEREQKSSEEQRILNYQLMPGGTAANTAIQLRRLRNRVFLNGAVGSDIFGNVLIEKMNEADVSAEDVDILEKEKTGLCFAAVQEKTGYRFLQTFRGANESFKPKKENWKAVNHFAGMNTFQIKEVESFMNYTSVNSYTPGGIVSFEQPEEIVRISRKFKVIFFNEKEWNSVSNAGKIRSNMVVITKGSSGAEIVGGPEHKGYDSKAKDTTGAGDAFCAGFLHLYAKKAPLIDCLAFGNILGSLTVKEYGAQGTFKYKDIINFTKSSEPKLLKYLEGAE
ncbi:MAG: carbohydrate kinase family protein [Thermotogota bacterium]|nr:carbohydrate kinase family protein [Thermotogota bacterium]